jgi:NAD(P)-dependent dehydrogenase (short-subunit alcohol dehydrogenase family)
MQLGLEGKRAVVTGASKGIGEATVLGLAAEGAAVACCARHPESLQDLSERAEKLPGAVHTFQADLTIGSQLEAFIRAAEAATGPTDILVNNVGASPSRNFLYMTDEEWLDGFNINLLAAVRCTRLVLAGMRKRRWGRIIMVSSGAAKAPSAPLIDYAAAKAAVLSISKSLARKYGADQVLVNSVLPGLIRTDMWERTAAEIAESSGTDRESVFLERGARVPLGRFGTSEEVADLIVFLASERAAYINGASIDIDGGLNTGM